MEQFLNEYRNMIGSAMLYTVFGAVSIIAEAHEVASLVFVVLGCISVMGTIVLTGRKIFPGKKKKLSDPR